MHTITIEQQPKRLVVRLHALTAKRHRDGVASLLAEFPAVRWADDASGYALPIAYRARLESWLARFDSGDVQWVAERPSSERKSA